MGNERSEFVNDENLVPTVNHYKMNLRKISMQKV